MLYFATREEAISYEPGEGMYAISKDGEEIILLACIEENQNVFGDEEGYFGDECSLRVDLFGLYGGDWMLDNDEILDPTISATGEVCGRNAGGICFDFEDASGWEAYPNAYQCLMDNVPDANEEVAVSEELEEIFELEDGVWIIVLGDPSLYF